MIESETLDRPGKGLTPVIRPCNGGWLKIQNGVPIITRSDEVNQMADGEVFNVKKADGALPVANEEVAAATITVVGNTGSVSILNASGKRVAISNILGQSVANTVLASDNVTISVPSGIVVVAIEGEVAVKALVK
jgi:hypothetical protein